MAAADHAGCHQSAHGLERRRPVTGPGRVEDYGKGARRAQMISHVAVVVPAADEQDHITDCLDGIATACDNLQLSDGRISTSVVVVLDSCSDATAEIVARHPGVLAVTSDERNVGAARRLGTEHALAHVGATDATWLANTDGDSLVPPTWLVDMVERANGGADLVLGTVVPGRGLPAAVERAWFSAHSRTDGHPHVHGANLGIRVSTYLTVGGWKALATGEDVDLVSRADRSSAVRVTRTATSPVRTSSRHHGRAPHGFASYLGGLTAEVLLEAASSTGPPLTTRLDLRFGS